MNFTKTIQQTDHSQARILEIIFTSYFQRVATKKTLAHMKTFQVKIGQIPVLRG